MVHLKSLKLIDRSRNLVGSEFQTVGPATDKGQRPNVIHRQPGTVSWCWLALTQPTKSKHCINWLCYNWL